MSYTPFSFTKKKEVPKVGACKKCGFSGHLTYQCRNLIKLGAEKNIEVEDNIIESNSDDEVDLNYLTPLQELRKQELEDEKKEKDSTKNKEHKKKKKIRKEKKSKHKKRKYSTSSADSDNSDDEHRSSHKKKKKKYKRD